MGIFGVNSLRDNRKKKGSLAQKGCCQSLQAPNILFLSQETEQGHFFLLSQPSSLEVICASTK